MANRLTEGRLKNKRFRTTEESILLACLAIKCRFTPYRLARAAQISRATFYRHHCSAADIASDYEDYILQKTRANFARLLKLKRVSLRIIYEQFFSTMFSNHRSMIFILRFGTPDFLEKMLLLVKPKLIAATKLKNQEALRVYLGEVSALIKSWCDAGFDREAIPDFVDKIIYLTDTAHVRLSALGSFDHQRESRMPARDQAEK